MDWIKKTCLKVSNEVVNHLAKCIAGFIILGLLVFCLFSWRWLASKHSLEILGWLWVTIFLAISGLSVLLFWLITKKPWNLPYTDENDIKIALEVYFRKLRTNNRGGCRQRLPITFTVFDNRSGVKRGSSKKHLESIANGFGYNAIRKGNKAIVFEYKAARKQSGFLDNLY